MNNIEDLFSKICRLCLSVNNSRNLPLFENGSLSCYGQAVALCANVELPNSENIPKNMCYNCLKHLRTCILFQKKCQNSQNYFKNICFTHSKRNLKENILRELYKDSISVKDDIINDSKEISSCDSKQSLRNREFNSTTQSNMKKGNNKAKPRNIHDSNTKSGLDTTNLTENDDSDFDTNDAVDTKDAVNDIFDLLEKETNQQVKYIQENNLKAKSLPQSGSSIYDVIIDQIDEITNNINAEDIECEKEHSNLPNKDINSIKKESNSIFLDLETNLSQNMQNTTIMKPDLIFKTIMHDFVSNEFNKQEPYKNTNKKTTKNDKDAVKILKHRKLVKKEFKTYKNETSKTDSIKKDKLELKYLKDSLDLTEKLHKDGLNLKCKYKNKVRDGTEIHKKIILNKTNDFSCKICNRTFKSKNTWLRHSERHAGITAFICELCGKGFVTKTELEVHLVYTHGTGRYYPCKECGYKAPKPFDLKEHMRLHTGERPYACDKCGLTFRRLYILRQHEIYHTEKKFQCPKCPLRFYKEAGLKDHDNNVHARRYMYACDLCSRQYARNKTVRQHLVKVHGVPREKQGKIKRVFMNETPLSQPPLEITTNNVLMQL